MPTLKDLLDTCSQIAQIDLTTDMWGNQTDYLNHPDAVRLKCCCNVLLTQLYRQFHQDGLAELPTELTDEVVLPYEQKDDKQMPYLTLETFCHGVLAEYFFQLQDSVRFKMWNERYERAMCDLRLGKKRKPLPKRRWI